MILTSFHWGCPKCQNINLSTSECTQCFHEVDLREQPCIHSNGFDMACDECGRSGFRFEGWNGGESIEDELVEESSFEPGFRCESMKGRVMTEAEFLAQHYKHGDAAENPFQKVYNETQPTTYRLYKLICSCGASLQCMEELEGVE